MSAKPADEPSCEATHIVPNHYLTGTKEHPVWSRAQTRLIQCCNHLSRTPVHNSTAGSCTICFLSTHAPLTRSEASQHHSSCTPTLLYAHYGRCYRVPLPCLLLILLRPHSSHAAATNQPNTSRRGVWLMHILVAFFGQWPASQRDDFLPSCPGLSWSEIFLRPPNLQLFNRGDERSSHASTINRPIVSLFAEIRSHRFRCLWQSGSDFGSSRTI